MSVKERRERQKLATREGILTAAREIAQTEGWGAVTIRRIADAIEYTPPIVYEYFSSKAAILTAIQGIGFEELAETLRQAGTDAPNQTERAVEMSLAYLRFAQRSPELEQVMHGWESASIALEETLVGANKVSAVVEEVLEEWAQETGAFVAETQEAVETLWALLLGLIAIRKVDRLGGDEQRAQHLAAQAVRDLLFAWENRSK